MAETPTEAPEETQQNEEQDAKETAKEDQEMLHKKIDQLQHAVEELSKVAFTKEPAKEEVKIEEEP